MPVFISYRHSDLSYARNLESRMRYAGIEVFIDYMDPTLRTTDDITAALLRHIDRCTHLMALVSDQSPPGWWVPFEIGAGSATDRRICCFQLGDQPLPDYLTKWPVLRTDQDLASFIGLYRQDQLVPLREGRALAANVSSAASFHAVLKALIGQR